MFFVYVQYKEEGVDVATLLVTFRDKIQFYQEDHDDWERVIAKLPLTFFVRNPDAQFEVLVAGEEQMPVHSGTLRISLV